MNTFNKNGFYIKVISGAIALFLACFLCACSTNATTNSESNTQQAKSEANAASITCGLTVDEKFDSAKLNISEQDFKDAGFELGDSLDVEFSNGTTLNDVPYYSGYYVKTGSNIVVSYPGENSVVVTKNIQGLCTEAGITNTCTVTVKLNAKDKYMNTEQKLKLCYTNNREDYSTDEQFSNFRALSGGNLKANFLFRGASSVDNKNNRASCTDKLVERASAKCILDLADSEANMKKYLEVESFNSPYTKALYEQGHVALLSMGSNNESQAYKAKVATGFRKLLNDGGPAFIHCLEGKDRTGFVCMLIEALAGATYDEMKSDYMETYRNYYNITETDDKARYDEVVNVYFNSFMKYLSNTDDDTALKTINYVQPAKNYLLDSGMTNEEIDALIALVCN